MKVIELPVFKPNKYLFENFREFGKNESDIYAEAVRRVMSEASGLPLINDKTDLSLK